MTATTMTTEFKRMNYCTLPSIDVPIIAPEDKVHHCNTCGGVIVNKAVKSSPHDFFPLPKWEHVEPAEDHYTTPKPTCHYCGSDESAVFKQMNWSDETHCARCGGVYGFPIGD